MTLSALGNAWAASNKAWLRRLFSSWGDVDLHVLRDAQSLCIGYEYILRNVQTIARLGTRLEIPPMEKGATCGSYGGRTKQGEPCKKAGTGLGNRCHTHPVSQVDIAYPSNSRISEIYISIGPDNALRPMPHVVQWNDMAFLVDQRRLQAIDFVGTDPCVFQTMYYLLNDWIVGWHDRHGGPTDFIISCKHGQIAASRHWPIERLREFLRYQGPWTTPTKQSVAQQGYLVGDYVPGVWSEM